MQDPWRHSKWVIQFQPVMCVILWYPCTAIYVVCLSTCVNMCLWYTRCVCVYFLSFPFFWWSQMSSPVVLHWRMLSVLLRGHLTAIVEGAESYTFIFRASLAIKTDNPLVISPLLLVYVLTNSMCLCDSLSIASELKVSAVSSDKQSTVTSPPWMRYQLCLRGVVPSNLSWKPVLELSFIPIRTSSKAHWAECFPTRIEKKK